MTVSYGVGTTFHTAGKHPQVATVVDKLKTYNLKGELVKTSYVSTHEFCGQLMRTSDVCLVSIQRRIIKAVYDNTEEFFKNYLNILISKIVTDPVNTSQPYQSNIEFAVETLTPYFVKKCGDHLTNFNPDRIEFDFFDTSLAQSVYLPVNKTKEFKSLFKDVFDEYINDQIDSPSVGYVFPYSDLVRDAFDAMTIGA